MAGRLHRVTWWSGFAVATLLVVSACSQTPSRTSSTGMSATRGGTTLTGTQEVPPVNTSASGVSTIEFLNDPVLARAVGGK